MLVPVIYNNVCDLVTCLSIHMSMMQAVLVIISVGSIMIVDCNID